MSSLLEQIKSKQKMLRMLRSEKERYMAEGLTVVIGECDRSEKSKVNDELVLKTIKKTMEGIVESQKYAGDCEHQILTWQAEALEEFIPRQLSREEIFTYVNNLLDMNVATGLKLGDVQKHFRENYPSQYDAKLVSEAFQNY